MHMAIPCVWWIVPLCARCVTVDAAGFWWLFEGWEVVLCHRNGRDCRCVWLLRRVMVSCKVSPTASLLFPRIMSMTIQ